MRKRTLLLCLVLVLGMVLAGCGNSVSNGPVSQASGAASDGATSGQEETEDTRVAAPDFTVYDVQGNAVRLSDFLGTRLSC